MPPPPPPSVIPHPSTLMVHSATQELPQRLRLDAVRGLKHIKEAALDLALPDNTTKTGMGMRLAITYYNYLFFD